MLNPGVLYCRVGAIAERRIRLHRSFSEFHAAIAEAPTHAWYQVKILVLAKDV